MSSRMLRSLAALAIAIVLFPLGHFVIGLPLGLAAMNFEAPPEVSFLLSWLPPGAVIFLTASALESWPRDYAHWPLLAFYLVVAAGGLGVTLLVNGKPTVIYGLVWCAIVVGAACLCHWPPRDRLHWPSNPRTHFPP